jgi:hypothetical protein
MSSFLTHVRSIAWLFEVQHHDELLVPLIIRHSLLCVILPKVLISSVSQNDVLKEKNNYVLLKYDSQLLVGQNRADA